MENKPNTTNDKGNDKKQLSKAKSYTPLKQGHQEASKRKSFNLNEAVMSLDLALGRMKKSKLVNSEYNSAGVSLSPEEMFMDSSPSTAMAQPGVDGSLMSINFSHYELIRNLSRSTSNSEGAYSGTTSTTISYDPTTKNEHLEKYFRSAEIWNRRQRESPPAVHFEVPEK